MRIPNVIKTISIGCMISALPICTNRAFAQAEEKDDFIVVTAPPEGTSEKDVLAGAPNPNVKIQGQMKTAKFVVDLSKNVLYKYNIQGKPEMAYMIASGKPSTPTSKGVRIVTHTETYPYKTAPVHTKRRRNPSAYGPKIILLNILDTKTGEQSDIGEFIHGNNNSYSLGRYVSHGWMRMDNEVIKQLAAETKRGDIVIIK